MLRRKYANELAETLITDLSATYITHSPSDSAFFGRQRCLVRMTLEAEIHYVIPTDGTVVDYDVPPPKGGCRPLRPKTISLKI